MRELWLVLGARLTKCDDLHYGIWAEGLVPNLANLPQAQRAYSDYLMAHIPEGVKTILDVGCGTGNLAQLLLERGYRVEGVSPSKFLSEMVRERLGPNFIIHPTKFEDLQTPTRYDLVMFAESFQYIDPALSLPKSHSVLNSGGHVLICDTFNNESRARGHYRGGHALPDFYRLLDDQPFLLLLDENITKETAPSITVLDDLRRDFMLPVWEALGYYFRSNHPWLTRLGRLFLGRRLNEIQFFSRMNSAEDFARAKSYHCMVLQKA